MLDIIYPVRPGETNEELRYSLRSLEASYPNHGTIWVVGHLPGWLTGVEFIEGNLSKSPRTNVYQNIQAACSHSGVSDEVIVMNDDFFITQPVEKIQLCYRGTLAAHLALPRLRVSTNGASWWKDSLLTTQVCLQALGYDAPLSYELHVPMPINRHRMRETLERFAAVTPANPPQWRSLYGNLHGEPDEIVQSEDSKVFRNAPLRRPYHSTTDLSWRHFRAPLAAMFPEPSRYELAAARRKVRA